MRESKEGQRKKGREGGREEGRSTFELLDHGEHVVCVLVVKSVPHHVLLLLPASGWVDGWVGGWMGVYLLLSGDYKRLRERLNVPGPAGLVFFLSPPSFLSSSLLSSFPPLSFLPFFLSSFLPPPPSSSILSPPLSPLPFLLPPPSSSLLPPPPHGPGRAPWPSLRPRSGGSAGTRERHGTRRSTVGKQPAYMNEGVDEGMDEGMDEDVGDVRSSASTFSIFLPPFFLACSSSPPYLALHYQASAPPSLSPSLPPSLPTWRFTIGVLTTDPVTAAATATVATFKASFGCFCMCAPNSCMRLKEGRREGGKRVGGRGA